jgi:hypothetical protein
MRCHAARHTPAAGTGKPYRQIALLAFAAAISCSRWQKGDPPAVHVYAMSYTSV